MESSRHDDTFTYPVKENATSNCPIECPDRKCNGVNLFFGKHKIHLDPFELLLFTLVATLPAGISIRDAWDGKLSFRESIERISMIAALSTVIRLSPTEQISSFLENYSIGKK